MEQDQGQRQHTNPVKEQEIQQLANHLAQKLKAENPSLENIGLSRAILNFWTEQDLGQKFGKFWYTYFVLEVNLCYEH